MPRFDTILFDLDGTLLYTLPDMCDSLNHALSTYGRPARTLEEVRGFVGNGVRRLVARALPLGEEDPAFADVYAEYSRHYAVHREDKTAPYTGIDALLDALCERDIACAVVTNKTHSDADAMVRRIFGSRIRLTVGKKDGYAPKPAIDAVEDVLAQLGAERDRALYVGDSEVDFQTAQNAGIACALVSWGYRDRAELEKLNAPWLADSPKELLQFIIG